MNKDTILTKEGFTILVVIPGLIWGGPALTAVLIKRFVPGVRPVSGFYKTEPDTEEYVDTEFTKKHANEEDEDEGSIRDSQSNDSYHDLPLFNLTLENQRPSIRKQGCKGCLAHVPWSTILGLFECSADTVNIITSVLLWIDEWRNHSNPLDIQHRSQTYAFLAFTIVLYYLIEIYNIRKIYNVFFDRSSFKRIQKIKSDCINPKNFKFWLWIWFYPNMCVIAPHAALLKVWFHWVSTVYTIYFMVQNRPLTPAMAGKIFSTVIEIPISIAQLIMLTMSFHQLRKIHKMKLKKKEWIAMITKVYGGMWVPIPHVSKIFLEKRKKF